MKFWVEPMYVNVSPPVTTSAEYTVSSSRHRPPTGQTVTPPLQLQVLVMTGPLESIFSIVTGDYGFHIGQTSIREFD